LAFSTSLPSTTSKPKGLLLIPLLISRQINISQRFEHDVAHNFLIGGRQHLLEDFDGSLGPVYLLVHIDLLKARAAVSAIARLV
jgi:hypothetical protein